MTNNTQTLSTVGHLAGRANREASVVTPLQKHEAEVRFILEWAVLVAEDLEEWER